MIALFATRLPCVLAVLAPVVLALQPTPAAATVGPAAGARDGANHQTMLAGLEQDIGLPFAERILTEVLAVYVSPSLAEIATSETP